jgi:hypothetical protein
VDEAIVEPDGRRGRAAVMAMRIMTATFAISSASTFAPSAATSVIWQSRSSPRAGDPAFVADRLWASGPLKSDQALALCGDDRLRTFPIRLGLQSNLPAGEREPHLCGRLNPRVGTHAGRSELGGQRFVP